MKYQLISIALALLAVAGVVLGFTLEAAPDGKAPTIYDIPWESIGLWLAVGSSISQILNRSLRDSRTLDKAAQNGKRSS